MQCKCISDFNKMLKERTGDENAHVNVSYRIAFTKSNLSDHPQMTCNYREKKKDGTWMKPKDHPISGEYCPFCGEKYPDD